MLRWMLSVGVSVTAELRQGAQLDKEVVLLGLGAHFELWDASLLTAIRTCRPCRRYGLEACCLSVSI
jgi:hypothetical protein